MLILIQIYNGLHDKFIVLNVRIWLREHQAIVYNGVCFGRFRSILQQI